MKTCPSATFIHRRSHTDWPGIVVFKTCRFKIWHKQFISSRWRHV